jgi:hypothetical protein
MNTVKFVKKISNGFQFADVFINIDGVSDNVEYKYRHYAGEEWYDNNLPIEDEMINHIVKSGIGTIEEFLRDMDYTFEFFYDTEEFYLTITAWGITSESAHFDPNYMDDYYDWCVSHTLLNLYRDYFLTTHTNLL